MRMSRSSRVVSRSAVLVSSLSLLAGGVVAAVSVQAVTAGQAAALGNGLALTPQMGWNSWNKFGCTVTENNVKAAADAIVAKGLNAAGYQYVNIDDCWQAPARDANGNLAADPNRFPSGIKALADYVHGKGLKLGIYATPGRKTCGEIWNGYPGQLGSLGHEQQDADTFAAWGVDYLKYDWCSADQDGVVASTAFPLMRDALNATGRPILFSIHDEPERPVPSWRPSAANSWRTTVDIHDNWSSMIGNAHNNQPLADLAAPGQWNDPDMLEVGNGGMTDTEYRTHFSLWAEMAAPLLMGNDIGTASQATLAILGNTKVIAVDQDTLGKQGTVVSTTGGLVVMTKPLAGGDRAVTLTNETGTATTITTTAQNVGIGGAASYTLTDLWSKTTTTSATGRISAQVPPHGTVMYRVTPSGTATPPVTSGGVYQITAGTQAVDDPNSSTATGTQLIGWHLNGGSNQKWTVTANSDGTWTLKNLASGLCADVNGASTSAGAAIIQWTCSGNANQRWLISPSGNGYTLTALHSGLVITEGSTTDGASLTQQPDTAAPTQTWSFTKVG